MAKINYTAARETIHYEETMIMIGSKVAGGQIHISSIVAMVETLL